MNFGEMLKDARKKKGLTFRQAEIRTGICGSRLNRLENGKRQNPTALTIAILAEAYGLNPAVVFLAAVDSINGRTQEAMRNDAERRKAEKIASLKRQIEKLETEV